MGDANSSYEKNQLKGEQEAHDQRAERPDFSEFTEDDWVRWINSFLNAELSDPIVRVGHQEPHQVLARIYSTLGDKSLQDRFGEAVARILESTPPIESNSSHLYFIIELISLVRPHRGKRLLRRYLRERSLLEFEFGLRNLHSMLLVAASKYDVDRGLVEIIKRSRPYIQDFTYRLICLRVLSLREDPDEYLQYLSDLLPELDSNAKAVALARQLKGVFFRHGHDRFCEWYIFHCGA